MINIRLGAEHIKNNNTDIVVILPTFMDMELNKCHWLWVCF